MYKVYKQTAATNLDSYKLGHAEQYAEGTGFVFSNFTPRSTQLFSAKDNKYFDNKIVVAGLRILAEEIGYLWKTTFFDVPKEEALAEFEAICTPFTGGSGVEFIKEKMGNLHDLGYLPIIIRGLPEGSVVNPGIPVLFIYNTHPDFYFLPNFMETWISNELWKCMTSATTARLYRKILNDYVIQTGSNVPFADYQIHDFSLRGQGGIVDGAKSGVGHLMFSLGSDCVPATKMIRDVYGDDPMSIASSVPASEHATASSNIIINTQNGLKSKLEAEIEFFTRYITEIYPTGVCSYVSDTYDYWGVLTEVLPACKELILNREENQYGLAKVVLRPDSGDPVRIICGYDDDEVADGLTPEEVKGSIQVLWDLFGGTVNELGYKTLNQRIGLIYGDSITIDRATEILERLKNKGFAADNIVFGVGSYTYQYVTRDTLGFAMKATYTEVADTGINIFKDPKTDNGTKKSAKGLLRVVMNEVSSDYDLLQEQDYIGFDSTIVYFDNGGICNKEPFADVRLRALATI